MRIAFEAQNVAEITKQMVDFLANVRTEPAKGAEHAKAAQSVAPESQRAPKTAFTVEDVRERFSRLIQAGKAEHAKRILADLGAQKLGELPEEKYAQAIESADALLA